MSQKVLVMTGDGINCERETARAFEEEGGQAYILHINDFLKSPQVLLDYSVLCFPGGFSFGDELRSGKILAEKLRTSFSDLFTQYTQQGGLTLGVCNGFQVLIQLGAFTGLHLTRSVTLATNDHGQFKDRWVKVKITESAKSSAWFQGMSGSLSLPIRHKEGKITLSESASKNLKFSIPLQYEEEVNGSFDRAAALLDESGQILGLMPHPEAATHDFLNPSFHSSSSTAAQNAAQVRKLFQNALQTRKKS